jgi:hypothetical protein
MKQSLTVAFLIFTVSWSCRAQLAPAPDLDSDFNNLEQGFKAKAVSGLGSESTANWQAASVYVSREFLADSATTSFNKANITIQAVFPKQTLNPQPKPFDIVMPHIIKSCDPPCPSCGGGPFGWACEGARAACIATTAPFVATCLVAKTALDAAAGLYLGHVSPYDLELAATMNASALRLSVSKDLNNTQLSTNLQLHGIVQGHANVDLTPLAGVFTACWPHQSMTIPPTGVQVSNPGFTAGSALQLGNGPDGITIQATVQDMNFDIQFDGNPVISVLMANPQVYITCALPAGILTSFGVYTYVVPLVESEKFTPGQVAVSLGKISLNIPGITTPATFVIVQNGLALGLVQDSTHNSLLLSPSNVSTMTLPSFPANQHLQNSISKGVR